MARTPLTPDDLADALAELPDWAGDVHGIHRRSKGIGFRAAAAHVLALADVADALDHHTRTSRSATAPSPCTC